MRMRSPSEYGSVTSKTCATGTIYEDEISDSSRFSCKSRKSCTNNEIRFTAVRAPRTDSLKRRATTRTLSDERGSDKGFLVHNSSFTVSRLAAFFSFLLEVEELVGDLFGGECVEHGHDPSGEFEV